MDLLGSKKIKSSKTLGFSGENYRVETSSLVPQNSDGEKKSKIWERESHLFITIG